MEIRDKRIDDGKAFDWGKTSKEYAKFRDIYPEEFYKKIVDRGYHSGQHSGQHYIPDGNGKISKHRTKNTEEHNIYHAGRQ